MACADTVIVCSLTSPKIPCIHLLVVELITLPLLCYILRLTHNYWHNIIPVGQGAVTYQLCNEDLRWATEMEEHRDRLGIEDSGTGVPLGSYVATHYT